MNVCANAAFRRADARLRAEYRRALGGTDRERRPLLRASQRAWLAYRDAHCRSVASDSEGGSLYPTELLSCKAEETDRRTDALRRELAADAH